MPDYELTPTKLICYHEWQSVILPRDRELWNKFFERDRRYHEARLKEDPYEEVMMQQAEWMLGQFDFYKSL